MAEKRIVIHYMTGSRAGMHKIIGHMVLNETDQCPARLDNIDMGDGVVGSVIHAATKPRYVLYREWQQPLLGVLNEFHPEQV